MPGLNLTSVGTSEEGAPALVFRAGAYTTLAGWNAGYWDTVIDDPGGNMYLNPLGTYKYKVPANGYYLTQAAFMPVPTVATRALAAIYTTDSVGNAQVYGAPYGDDLSSVNNDGVLVSGMRHFTAGTYVTAFLYTSATCTLYGVPCGYFSIVRVA